MSRKPIYWVLLIVLSLGGTFFAYHYFPAAFPLVNLDLKMNREQAIESAANLAETHAWGPEEYRVAASFDLDATVQNFVELEAGGREAFNAMLTGDRYSPYRWVVRHFKEGEKNETIVRFTPAGTPYGFREKLAEADSGASLPMESALEIARTGAAQWPVDLSQFELVEKSQQLQTGGRTDHTFVYERPDEKLGEGSYRLRLVVGGDRLTELTHFVKIPEAFTRRYEEMRSANDTIATSGTIAMGLLYGILGLGFGLFYMMRERWIIWKRPLYWGIFVAALQVLAMINRWPLTWMHYDTALSAQTFFMQQITMLVLIFISEALLLTLSFMAAETLTRKAFPDQVQLWKIWEPKVASSKTVLGQTIGGFLAIGLFFAFDVALYFLATRVLGWWGPSSALFEPDILATYQPWFSSIAISLHAGFWEECLFRAIPIAGAVLIGRRYGKEKLALIIGFIIQALIFGAAHANYPNQPAYARVVELIIPSIGFGLIYLYYGLLPGIILHFAFDVVWFALPLFVSTAPGIWTQRILVLIFTLVPVWVVFWARMKEKKWLSAPDKEAYNLAFKPAPNAEKIAEPTKARVTLAFSRRALNLLLLGGIGGLILWVSFANFQNFAPKLNSSRDSIEKIATDLLVDRGFDVDENWQTFSAVQEFNDQDDRFIWQNEGDSLYQELVGRHLLPPRWRVRYAQFEGDVAERAEEFNVFYGQDGKLLRFWHKLPESREGANLSEADARGIVAKALKECLQADPEALKSISVSPTKLDNRTDWEFTYADTTNWQLKTGEARLTVKLAGDEVVDAYRWIHVPEDWARQDRDQRSSNRNIGMLVNGLLFVLLFTVFVLAIVKWSRGEFSVKTFVRFLILLGVLQVINLINELPGVKMMFSTAEPYMNQMGLMLGGSLFGVLIVAGGAAMILGFLQAWRRDTTGESRAGLVAGFCMGTLIVGLLALVNNFAPSPAPFWADYSALTARFPVAAAGLGGLSHYINQTLIYLVIFIGLDKLTVGWTKKRGLYGALMILTGIVLTSLTTYQDIPFWLLVGAAKGLILLLAYIILFRYQLSLIPVTIAVLELMQAIKVEVMNPHPLAVTGATLTIFLILILAIFWEKWLRTKK